MKAADLLKSDCPAHKYFKVWLKGRTPSRRLARKFLRKFPNYRGVICESGD